MNIVRDHQQQLAAVVLCLQQQALYLLRVRESMEGELYMGSSSMSDVEDTFNRTVRNKLGEACGDLENAIRGIKQLVPYAYLQTHFSTTDTEETREGDGCAK